MQLKEQPFPTPQNPFIKVKCGSCGNEQTVYAAPASTVKCLVCSNPVVKPAATRGKLEGKALEVFPLPETKEQ